jgi:hypothetical protein
MKKGRPTEADARNTQSHGGLNRNRQSMVQLHRTYPTVLP